MLERAGLVRCASAGRERLYEFNPAPVEEMREYVEFVSAQWEAPLGRLKAFGEK